MLYAIDYAVSSICAMRVAGGLVTPFLARTAAASAAGAPAALPSPAPSPPRPSPRAEPMADEVKVELTKADSPAAPTGVAEAHERVVELSAAPTTPVRLRNHVMPTVQSFHV